jgi:integrase
MYTDDPSTRRNASGSSMFSAGAPRATPADVSSWLGDLMRRGLARSTATRALATLRSLLSFAVADGRVTVNAAAAAKAPTGGQARREGRFLDLDEVVALAQACRGPYAELVYVLAMQGLRWGELAGLQVGDRVMVPGRGCGCHGRF